MEPNSAENRLMTNQQTTLRYSWSASKNKTQSGVEVVTEALHGPTLDGTSALVMGIEPRPAYFTDSIEDRLTADPSPSRPTSVLSKKSTPAPIPTSYDNSRSKTESHMRLREKIRRSSSTCGSVTPRANRACNTPIG